MLVLALPLAALLVAEFALEFAGYGYNPSFWVPLKDGSAVITSDAFGWRFFPRSLARTPVPEIVATPKPTNTKRIFILGESAAMGFPEPSVGLAPMLQRMLEEANPDIRWEVQNAAMTAINSHVILPIARECAKLQPDVFIVLAGNNEAVGPFGPATVFGRAGQPLTLARLTTGLSASRLSQALARAVSTHKAPEEWRGMEMFTRNQLRRSDPKLERMYRNFGSNLTAIVRAGTAAKAEVFLLTVPVNLRDSPPFASVHRDAMTKDELARWQAAYNTGVEAQAAGDHNGAIQEFNTAIGLDGEHAESLFRLAVSLAHTGRRAEALERFRAARDADALRFRADSKINNVVREVARAERARLIDAETQFDMAGSDLFWEHVHFTPAGTYKLAAAIAKELGISQVPSEDAIRTSLPVTPWDEVRLRSEIAAMMERPPFTGQIGNTERVAALRRSEDVAGMRLAAQIAFDRAVEARPSDIHLLTRRAALLRESGQPAQSAAAWTKLIQLVPGKKAWYVSRGAAWSDAGQQNDAIQDNLRALAIDPEFDLALFGLGVAKSRLGKHEEAAQHYTAALRLKPDYSEASYNLAGTLATLGRRADAQRQLEDALLAKPAFAEAHVALAQIYAHDGRTSEAVNHYRQAVYLKPDLAEAQYDLGLLLSRQDRIQEAIAHYREAIRVRPDYPEAHNNLGIALARNGETRAAVLAFARAIELNPSFEAARANLERVRRAGAARK
jgi:tetratricopeptide (TPR) repeat protein